MMRREIFAMLLSVGEYCGEIGKQIQELYADWYQLPDDEKNNFLRFVKDRTPSTYYSFYESLSKAFIDWDNIQNEFGAPGWNCHSAVDYLMMKKTMDDIKEFIDQLREIRDTFHQELPCTSITENCTRRPSSVKDNLDRTETQCKVQHEISPFDSTEQSLQQGEFGKTLNGENSDDHMSNLEKLCKSKKLELIPSDEFSVGSIYCPYKLNSMLSMKKLEYLDDRLTTENTEGEVKSTPHINNASTNFNLLDVDIAEDCYIILGTSPKRSNSLKTESGNTSPNLADISDFFEGIVAEDISIDLYPHIDHPQVSVTTSTTPNIRVLDYENNINSCEDEKKDISEDTDHCNVNDIANKLLTKFLDDVHLRHNLMSTGSTDSGNRKFSAMHDKITLDDIFESPGLEMTDQIENCESNHESISSMTNLHEEVKESGELSLKDSLETRRDISFFLQWKEDICHFDSDDVENFIDEILTETRE